MNFIFTKCADCGKHVRLTGLFAGWHLCLTDEELAAKKRYLRAVKSQKRTIQMNKGGPESRPE